MAPPQVISQQLLRRNHALIPYPALSEKTLVLAEYAVVGTADTPDSQLSLMARWDQRGPADVALYPHQCASETCWCWISLP